MPLSKDFQLGLLPERRMNWRTFATSYGAVVLGFLFMISAGYLFPDQLHLHQRYTVTELIPRPDLAPKPVQQKKMQHHVTPVKVKPVTPVFTAKMFVPKELVHPKKKEEERAHNTHLVTQTPAPERVHV